MIINFLKYILAFIISYIIVALVIIILMIIVMLLYLIFSWNLDGLLNFIATEIGMYQVKVLNALSTIFGLFLTKNVKDEIVDKILFKLKENVKNIRKENIRKKKLNKIFENNFGN